MIRFYFILFSLLCLLLMNSGASNASDKISATFAYLAEGLNELKDERQIAIVLWFEELSRDSGIQFKVLPVDSLKELKHLVQTQQVDFVLISSLYFLQEQSTLADYLGKDLLAINRAKDLYESFVIFTREDFIFKDFTSLRHRRLSLRDDNILLKAYLKLLTKQTAKLEPEQFFKIKATKSISQPVLDVYFESADAGLTPKFAFDRATDLNPSMLTKLKIVHSSPAQFIPALIFSSKHTPEVVQNQFIDSMQNIQKLPRGKQIINLFKIDSIQAISFEELKPLYDFYRQIELFASKKSNAP